MLIQDKKGTKNQLLDKIISYCWKLFIILEASCLSPAGFGGHTSVFCFPYMVLGQPRFPPLDGGRTSSF